MFGAPLSGPSSSGLSEWLRLAQNQKGPAPNLKGTSEGGKGSVPPLTKEQKRNYVLRSFKTEGHCHGPRRHRRGSCTSVTHPVPGNGCRLGRGARGAVSGRVRGLAADAAAVDSVACVVDSAACIPPSSMPLESQMASAEHHGCREIGWRKSGWGQIGCPSVGRHNE